MPAIAFVVTTFSLLTWLAYAKQRGDMTALHRIGWLMIALTAIAAWALFHIPVKVILVLVSPCLIIELGNRYLSKGAQRWAAIVASSAALLLLVPLGYGARIIPAALFGLVLQLRAKEKHSTQSTRS
jgi:hypothetical protein